jgi:DNA-directed RNA polymerase specialized sigma24 family protein
MAGSEAAPVAVESGWAAEQVDELRRLYPALRRFAAVVGRLDVDPDDLVQEAYAQVLRRPAGAIRDLGPYLRRTVVHLAQNERRKASRGRAAAQRAGAGDVGTLDEYPSALADLLQLAPAVRGLLYLVEVDGEPVAAAADAVGMSAGAARMALTRARRRLRTLMTTEWTSE